MDKDKKIEQLEALVRELISQLNDWPKHENYYELDDHNNIQKLKRKAFLLLHPDSETNVQFDIDDDETSLFLPEPEERLGMPVNKKLDWVRTKFAIKGNDGRQPMITGYTELKNW